MGEALISRRGSGSKVIINGEKFSQELNLLSAYITEFTSILPKEQSNGTSVNWGVVLNDKLFYIGNTENGSSFSYIYDGQSWNSIRAIDSYYQPISYNNKIYFNYRGFLATFYENQDGTYAVEYPLRTSVNNEFEGGFTITDDGKVHLFGGYYYNSSYQYDDRHCILDLTTNEIIYEGTTPFTSSANTSPFGTPFTFNNEVYWIGGPSLIKQFYKFNSNNNSWTEINLPQDFINEYLQGNIHIFILDDGAHIYGYNRGPVNRDSTLDGTSQSHWLWDGVTIKKLQDFPICVAYGNIVKYNDCLHFLGTNYENSKSHLTGITAYKKEN